MMYMVALNYISSGSVFSLWFMSCENPMMAETSVVEGRMDLISPCNRECQCTTRRFEPVCGSGRNYFSPCHAGCTHQVDGQSTRAVTFGGCQCVPLHTVTKGFCQTNCTSLTPYLTIVGMEKLLKSTSSVGDTLILLRCVEPKDKSFALGLMISIINLMGECQMTAILLQCCSGSDGLIGSVIRHASNVCADNVWHLFRSFDDLLHENKPFL